MKELIKAKRCLKCKKVIRDYNESEMCSACGSRHRAKVKYDKINEEGKKNA